MPINTINHSGKEIIFIDYKNCRTQPEMISLLAESAEFIKKKAGKVLTLSDFTGTFGSQEFMNEANKLNKEVFSPKLEKGAVLGVTGIKKILLEGYNLLSKKTLEPFGNKEEALAYLTKT